MGVELSEPERAELEQAAKAARRVRQWRRYQAILLLGQGKPVLEVSQALGCSRASVYQWHRAWRAGGVAGLAEGRHTGRRRTLDAAAETRLDGWLEAGDPQAHGYHATGWTAPLLQTELTKHTCGVGVRTVRRALDRLEWHWKRPKYVLGRRDPDYAAKKGA